MKRFVFILLAVSIIVSPVFASGAQETAKKEERVKVGVIYTIAGLGPMSLQ